MSQDYGKIFRELELIELKRYQLKKIKEKGKKTILIFTPCTG